ncbi:uncharacterized protein si:dkey-30e9.6 isoform X2 [Betta splendens]|nr:uncharacterized protein si:dkey-30e9.6 isoform X2 [Betta splendens]
MFVKSGKYACECYKNPKAHNFRPLDETLPDIVTNLDVKLKHVDTLCTGNTGSEWSLRTSSVRMDTHKPAAPHWDSGLILPPLPWPPKSASYTRHRRRRGAYSAFLERVEEKLSRSWKNRSEQV